MLAEMLVCLSCMSHNQLLLLGEDAGLLELHADRDESLAIVLVTALAMALVTALATAMALVMALALTKPLLKLVSELLLKLVSKLLLKRLL